MNDSRSTTTLPMELPLDRPLTECETPLGRVRGFERAGARTFLGLPYGTFAGRFRPVDPPQAWPGTRDATTYAARCPQPVVDDPSVPPARGEVDENCFHLNVHAPLATGDGAGQPLRPVIVWIHGGGFLYGSANDHDGSALAVAADAVVVCVNYRLGLLGWLDVSELGADHHHSADVWLTDLVAALQWVRDNVSAFGGDPNCVTVIGNSAGGASVLALYQADGARGLFHRAVACSPPHFASEPRPDLLTVIAKKRRSTREEALTWALDAPASDLTALRFGDASPLTAGGPIYRRSAQAAINALGDEAPPILTGFTSAEGDFFLSFMTSWRFRGPLGRLVLALMSRSMLATCADGRDNITTYSRALRRHHRVRGRRRIDLMFVDIFRRASISSALAATRAGSRGYLYELDVPCTINGTATGSAHGADQELTFNVFADPDAWPGLRMLDFDRAPTLAVAWVEMLSAFAREGVPGDAWGSWNGYDEETRSSMLIRKNGGSLQKDRDGEHRRAVWGETT